MVGIKIPGNAGDRLQDLRGLVLDPRLILRAFQSAVIGHGHNIVEFEILF
jgi:hypothetical protein